LQDSTTTTRQQHAQPLTHSRPDEAVVDLAGEGILCVVFLAQAAGLAPAAMAAMAVTGGGA
jgi:hypothetical protein